MRKAPTCPRCGGPVREPSAWSSAWQCDVHGEVHPLRTVHSPSAAGLEGTAARRGGPGLAALAAAHGLAGHRVRGRRRRAERDPRLRRRAVRPEPGRRPREMLLVSEELGVGLGAGCAGLAGPDPGSDFAAGPPHALVRFGNHEFPLWNVEAPGRAAFAGEVMGNWLWLILWPDTAGMLLVEPLELRDLRDPGQDLDLPFGAPSQVGCRGGCPRLRVGQRARGPAQPQHGLGRHLPARGGDAAGPRGRARRDRADRPRHGGRARRGARGAAAGADAGAGHGAVLPPGRPQRAPARLPVRPGRRRNWPRSAPGSGRAACTGPRRWSSGWPNWARRSPGSRCSAIAGDGVVGRPHVARAMVEAGVIESPDQAFGPDWIGAGGRAHVPRYALDPARAIALIRAAGGVTVLAHPRAGARGWTVPDDVIADLAAAGLAGVEVWHPDQDQAQRAAAAGSGRGPRPGRQRRQRRSRGAHRLPDRLRYDRARRVRAAGVTGHRRRAGDAGDEPVSAGGSGRTGVTPARYCRCDRRVAAGLRGRQVAMEARIERAGTTANSWIVGDDEEVIVVDPGDDAASVLAAGGRARGARRHLHARPRGATRPPRSRWRPGTRPRWRCIPRTACTGGRRTRATTRRSTWRTAASSRSPTSRWK